MKICTIAFCALCENAEHRMQKNRAILNVCLIFLNVIVGVLLSFDLQIYNNFMDFNNETGKIYVFR